MKQLRIIIFLFLVSAAIHAQKPRLLITTDIGGDPDDQQALVRLMLYANEFDIQGLISSAAGTPGELKKNIVYPEKIIEIIQAYSNVYFNLVKHDKEFPSPGKLLEIVKKGNPNRGWDQVGHGNDTEGSEWIIRMADKKDKRLLNICLFGGQTDLAQALWKVKNTRSVQAYQNFIAKIRVFDIDDQDRIFRNIITEHPSIFYILSKAAPGQDKRNGAYRGMYLGGDESLTSIEWLTTHVLIDHGPLGKLYPTKTWTDPNPYGAMKEGDTPSWFFFLDNGLNIPASPEYGGWGGRYQKNDQGYYSDAMSRLEDEKDVRATVYRWRGDFQREFSARMDWCVNEYSEANHAPEVLVNKSKNKEPLKIQKKAGETIYLDAGRSKDPDLNSLKFEWFFYPQAGNYYNQLPELSIEGAGVSFIMPELAPGTNLHLILKVTDNGSPALSSYRRIILTH